MNAGGPPFVKGHGTENDFILIPDLENVWEPTESQVRAVCDRRAGLGADGLIRIVPAVDPPDGYFMDYRNGDGSVAEMCGNGARVFVRYLVDAGLERLDSFTFGTRGGVRIARLGGDGAVSIDMGPATVGTESKADLAGTAFTGTAVDVGNPHLVCVMDADSGDGLAQLDLTRAPTFDAGLFPSGVNVEFVVPLAPDRIRMRVYERGVGETRSCGSGAVAAAAAFLASGREERNWVTVEVPGGSVLVNISATGSTLTGPAVLVASGTIEPDFWDANR